MKMTSRSASVDTKSMIENLVSLKEKENKILKETKNLEWKKRKQSLIKEIRRKIFENIKFLLPIIGGRKFSLKILKGEPSFENQKYWHIMLNWKIAENLIIECKSDSDNRWFVPKTNRGFVECFVLNKKREIISNIKLWFGDNKISTFEKFKQWLLENKNNFGEFTKDPRPNFLFYKKKEIKEKKRISVKKTKLSSKPKTKKEKRSKQINKAEEIQRLKEQVKTAEYEASLERNARINAENSARYEFHAKAHEEYKDKRRSEILSELSESYGWNNNLSDHDKDVLERANSI
jgi:hypothetical protein